MLRRAAALACAGGIMAYSPRAWAKVTIKALGEGMKLTSSAFAEGQPIPKRFTCEGENLSPPLSWSGGTGDAKSFALVCWDPDAPRGVFHHWAIYDLPASTKNLPEGVPNDLEALGGRQGVNDFGAVGYKGPCPPPGHGLHHYHFDIFAMPVERLEIPKRANVADILAAARDQALSTGTLIGVYKRG